MRALRHLVPVAWIAFILALGVRGIVADDARYAWGMFPYVLRYTVDYRWRLQDAAGNATSATTPFKPGAETKHARATFGIGKEREHWYGLGALTSELATYARFIDAHAPKPAHARNIEIVVRYKKGPEANEHVVVVTGAGVVHEGAT